MLKNRSEQIQILVRFADAVICILAFLAAFWVRFASPLFEYGDVGPLESVSWMLAASLTLHLVLYPACGFYESLRLKSVPNLILMVLRAFIVEFFVLGTLVFLIQAKTTSRYFFGLFLVLNYGAVFLEKIGARVLLSSIRRRGYNYRQVLIVGGGSNAARVVSVLRRNKHWGYVPCGILKASEEEQVIPELADLPVMGVTRDLERIVRSRAVDEVYFATEVLSAGEIVDQVAFCEKLGIPTRFSLSFFELPNSKVTFNVYDGLPVLTFYTTLMTPLQAAMKRVIDIVIAIIGLLITAVVYPWIAWRIKKESEGPVIFKQVRVGENGRRFKCYKFRTMYLDAEKRKEELLARNQMEGPIFKIDNDPRVTPFGAFLRRTSLDELPQFFNIFRGDMSVVGTRPPTPDEVLQYETHYRRRLSVRPGLTGLWQVSGRSRIRRFEDILALDLQYIDRWSIWLDIQIIFQTIWVLLFRKGAY